MTMPNDALHALVATAMMQALDQAKRDELIRTALEHLITPLRSNAYQTATSPLQDAFNSAVRETARAIIEEMLTTEKVRVQIRTLAARAFEKMATDNGDLAGRMAEALAGALSRDR